MKCLHCYLVDYDHLFCCYLISLGYCGFIVISPVAIKEDQVQRTTIIIYSLIINLSIAHFVAIFLVISYFMFLVMVVTIFCCAVIFGFALLVSYRIVVIHSSTHLLSFKSVVSIFRSLSSMHPIIALICLYLICLIG